MIDGTELIKWLEERKKWVSQFSFGERAVREIDIVINKIKEIQGYSRDEAEVVDFDIYDKCEVHENCTVQILSNSITGEVSVGWWEDTADEIRTI